MVKQSQDQMQHYSKSSIRIEPWWVDAHFFFPILLGPLAFLLTALPGVEEILAGHSSSGRIIFERAVLRLLGFGAAGFGAGLMIRLIASTYRLRSRNRLDITVGQSTPDSIKVTMESTTETVAIPVSLEVVQPGMKLAESLLSPDGVQLGIQNALLTEKMIEEARQAGVQSLKIEGTRYVSDQEETPAEPGPGNIEDANE